MEYDEIVAELQALANPEAVAGMARFGINPHNTYGVSVTQLRKIAKHIGRHHELAQQLWRSDIHEARILASLVADPALLTVAQMEQWVADFASWDVCDQCCNNLYKKTPFAYHKALEWSDRDEEFIKRAGFALMASLAVYDKRADDGAFVQFLPIIQREATDERNFVKKAVNWALRQIGKRNRALNQASIAAAQQLQQHHSRSARWIANDALRELTSEKIQAKLHA